MPQGKDILPQETAQTRQGADLTTDGPMCYQPSQMWSAQCRNLRRRGNHYNFGLSCCACGLAKGAGQSAAVLGMIDSGAAEILLHSGIGEAMGIDIASGEKPSMAASAGSSRGIKHTLRMQVRGDRNLYEVACALPRLRAWMRYLASADFSKTTRSCSRNIRTSLRLSREARGAFIIKSRCCREEHGGFGIWSLAVSKNPADGVGILEEK